MRQEFSIVARTGKKGMTYYVRYFINNKMIPSQWSTKTNDPEEAKIFAKIKKEIILNKYFKKKEGKTLYTILGKYYESGSSYLVIDAVRGRKLGENSRKILHGFILNTFVPFLQRNKIKDFEEINAVLINRFQNYLLLEKKLLPQSINRQISGIKAIFNHLFMTGVIKINAIKDTVPLRSMNNKVRGCYSLDDLEGIFKNQWIDRKSYLLCALIYSTGLRNNEISNLKVKDIIRKDTLHCGSIDFLNIEKSKTVNGIRKIPLHHKVKDALSLWVDEHNLLENDFLFISNEDQRFYRYARRANLALGAILGKEKRELDSLNISFYSGRHFYKTMLNSYNLGDVEEIFMGHSVNRNVSELYNHKDKRGEKELLKAARNAIEIIDKCLFQ
jgi:integrase